MKHLLLLLLSLCPLAGLAAPYGVGTVPNVQTENRYRFTSNPDHILSDAAVAEIDSICYALRHRAIAQVAVVAVRAIDTDDVFDFAYRLFSSWGVGRADNDNGLGILFVEDAREIRFITGRGLEGVLPDALAKRIQTRYMLPWFREGDYSRGMVERVRAVAGVLTGSELDLGGNDDYAAVDRGWSAGEILLFILLMTLFPLGMILYGILRMRRCPRCHAYALRQQSVAIVEKHPAYDVVEYTYRCGRCGKEVKKRVRRSKGGGSGGIGRGIGGGMILGGGRGFRGGGGSMGGGFGGGSFGGGGAGSRW